MGDHSPESLPGLLDSCMNLVYLPALCRSVYPGPGVFRRAFKLFVDVLDLVWYFMCHLLTLTFGLLSVVELNWTGLTPVLEIGNC